MASEALYATFDATNTFHQPANDRGRHRDTSGASRRKQIHLQALPAHLTDMSNHTIAAPITSWAELRTSDREVLNRSEVALLLTLDPRTIDHALADGTIPSLRIGRRVLIPRRPFLRTFGVDDEVGA
jgi:excisionase family DNA binding protein